MAVSSKRFKSRRLTSLAVVVELTLLPSSTAGLPEYIGMTLFLQSAAATFTAFDAQRSGRITLDFNQWWGSVLLATCTVGYML